MVYLPLRRPSPPRQPPGPDPLEPRRKELEGTASGPAPFPVEPFLQAVEAVVGSRACCGSVSQRWCRGMPRGRRGGAQPPGGARHQRGRLRRQRHRLKDLRLIVKQPRGLRRDIGDDVSGNGAQLRLSPCSAGGILPLRANLCHNSLCYR